jgi:hypothetical protein
MLAPDIAKFIPVPSRRPASHMHSVYAHGWISHLARFLAW